jgi:hypothetical protein
VVQQSNATSQFIQTQALILWIRARDGSIALHEFSDETLTLAQLIEIAGSSSGCFIA